MAEQDTTQLPVQFQERVRPDIVKRAVLSIQSKNRQSYGADERAGKKHVTRWRQRNNAYRSKKGRGKARLPRKIMHARGMQLWGEGAEAPNTRGGRRAHPPKPEKDFTEEINDKERRKYKLSNGDIVIGRSGSVGQSYVYDKKDGEMVYASYLIKFKIDLNKVTKDYIRIYLKSPIYWSQVYKNSRKSVQTNLNAGEIKDFYIPIPPLEKQKEIANNINNKLDIVNFKKNKLRKLKKKCNNYKENILRCIFSNKYELLDVNSLDDDVFENCESWDTVSLNKVANFQNGYSFSKDQWESEGLPIIRIQNLTGTSNNFNYYSGEIDDKYKVNNNDILFAWSGTIDAFKWDGKDAWLNQHIYKVKPSNIYHEYLYLFLKYISKELESKKIGGTIQHIRKNHITDAKIPVPDISKQKKIANIINQRIKNINKCLYSINEMENNIESYKKSLLYNSLTI